MWIADIQKAYHSPSLKFNVHNFKGHSISLELNNRIIIK